uniref:Pre-rRNA-processing protein TSR1 homolog n=1 Tax=Ditylenchus dipsaci TaxID=166011 RepID=A0A915CT56_9BILA
MPIYIFRSSLPYQQESGCCALHVLQQRGCRMFKPIEIYTPKGRRGHIKESLGTHGLLKVLFDQALTTQDAVMMNLYKRVFPKWSYNPRISHGGSSTKLDELKDKMEE